ncbi:MAG: acylphosphatase [archaeon]
MPKVSVFVKFFGRVQGVGFRMQVVGLAKKNNIFGWVKNSYPEDLVEAVFCGEKANIDALILVLKENTGFMRVDKVVVEDYNSQEEFTSFNIKY